ncbi:hypothetical protein CD149_09365 [Staphylococcus condimenti]|uniref:Lipoprotein n=1 Tax=Staphylococcus condimenti TaxID=70255 RepID=A0A143PB75_9STAP|nr:MULTISPECIES: hypothetical protein [Staphylococcus]AMY05696.1 hypothetical protein A4G25_07045 [Staphylococcus condimenti]APR61903.1 hypothetical protein BTZ13_12065 [Staphylococcus condimenti]MDK8646249.1 hypothetical protein [Staphylococcus condimenti]OFO99153.1 hypothetical protein HMPREF3007_06465 [Staphylococcus sp. HMSC065E08]PNZ59079.1 hypothetical protein CD149_09365 [Staphylococcus condimenti]
MKKIGLMSLCLLMIIVMGCTKGDRLPSSVKNDLHKADRKIEAVKIFEIDHKQVVYEKKDKKLTVPLHFKEDVELPPKLVGSMATTPFSGNEDVDYVEVKYELKGHKHELHYKRDKHGMLRRVN